MWELCLEVRFLVVVSRVARWFTFKPNPSFGAFLKPFEWNILISFKTIWYTLWQFALFYGNLAYVVAKRYIIPILVHCIKKNLATLVVRGHCPRDRGSAELTKITWWGRSNHFRRENFWRTGLQCKLLYGLCLRDRIFVAKAKKKTKKETFFIKKPKTRNQTLTVWKGWRYVPMSTSVLPKCRYND
jgi:hypothetical protein